VLGVIAVPMPANTTPVGFSRPRLSSTDARPRRVTSVELLHPPPM
jgi:hypothetical protein